jgi:small subunit ribosomal protein S1
LSSIRCKSIIVSHSRIHEDLADDSRKKGNNKRTVAEKKVEMKRCRYPCNGKNHLGDIEELAA